jgi:hypothetical protein
VTAYQDFQYDELDGPLCYTTCHNGGVLIWDNSFSPPIIVSRIAASQHGGWRYSEQIQGELGDAHRAVILEGGSSSFSELDNIEIDSRLLFFSNNVMGFIVCDVSKPDAPQFVWQWDCDTRSREANGEGADWDWFGSGDVLDDLPLTQADAEEDPAHMFGIGVASYRGNKVLQDPPIIHVYLAGSYDGLRLFDLSNFLDPFGYGADGDDLNYDDFSIDIYNDYAIGLYQMQAYDLQTHAEDGDTYVFTSWTEIDADDEGYIGLTVHLDEDVE